MKHLIIAGVPRSGKSTLSRFERCFPETGIDTGLSVNKNKSSMEILHIISGKIGPFLRAMTDPEEYDRKNGPMVIDMYQLLPEDYAKYLDPDICGIIYLLTGDVTPEERCRIQKEFDTPEDYTYELSDQERLEGCGYLVEQSGLLREQCEHLGLPYFETARDRETVFDGIMEKLRRDVPEYEN